MRIIKTNYQTWFRDFNKGRHPVICLRFKRTDHFSKYQTTIIRVSDSTIIKVTDSIITRVSYSTIIKMIDSTINWVGDSIIMKVTEHGLSVMVPEYNLAIFNVERTVQTVYLYSVWNISCLYGIQPTIPRLFNFIIKMVKILLSV
jgi:hypothetical protein